MTGLSPSLLERVGRFLLGLADLFEQLIPKLREFGLALIAEAARLIREGTHHG
jgi:hypothetical protein